MPDAGRFRPTPAWLLPGLAAALLLALFAYATAPGLSGTGDSRYYLFAAQSWRHSGRLLHLDGTPYRYWPPLYPLLLAALSGGPAAIRVLHAVALLGTLALWSWLGRQLLPPRPARFLPLLLALSAPALMVSKFVWAETVFGLLIAAYSAALWQWRRTGRAGWAALATATGALLPLHRTAGFFFLAGIALGLLLELTFRAARRASAGKAPGAGRLGPLLLHGLGCVAGGLVWHWYSLLIAAPVFYQRNRGWAQLLNSAADYGLVLTRWLLPVRASWREAAGASFAWALVLPALLLILWPRPGVGGGVGMLGRAGLTAAPGAAAPPLAGPATPAQPALAFRRLLWWALAVYVLLMLVSTTFTRSGAGHYDAERYASALFAPVLLLALGALPHRPTTRAGRLARGAALAGLLLYSAERTIQTARQLHDKPVLPPSAWAMPPAAPALSPPATAAPAAGRGSGPAARPRSAPAADAAAGAQFRPAAPGQSAGPPAADAAR